MGRPRIHFPEEPKVEVQEVVESPTEVVKEPTYIVTQALRVTINGVMVSYKAGDIISDYEQIKALQSQGISDSLEVFDTKRFARTRCPHCSHYVVLDRTKL